MTEGDGDAAEADAPGRRVPWRRIASAVGLLVLLAIVIPFVVYAVPQLVGAEHSYAVLSGSMEPTMSPGDAVIVNSVSASAIAKGDIITFSQSGADRPTTHRVVEVVQEDGTRAFRTKGDANEDADQSVVTPNQVQGRVMSLGGHPFVIPYIGYVLQFANTQYGFVLLLALPLTLLIFSEIWSVIVAAGDNSATSEPDTEGGSDEGDDGGNPEDPDSWKWGAAPADTDTEPTDDQSDAIAFSAAELQLGLIVLAGFLAYSLWVAYATFETWAFGVAGGVGAALLLLLALYYTGGSSDSDPGAGSTDGVDDGGIDTSPTASDGGTAEHGVSEGIAAPVPEGGAGPEADDETVDTERDTQGGETDV